MITFNNKLGDLTIRMVIITFRLGTSIDIAPVFQELLHEVNEWQDGPSHQRRLEERTSRASIERELYDLLDSPSHSTSSF